MMELHKILQRQFTHIGLSENGLPTDISQWQDFIGRVNKVYKDNDEERYLIERSMELSSREINELNEKIQNAQHIAGIGYWHFDSQNDVLVYSDELKHILHFSSEEPTPKYENVLSAIQKEQSDKFKNYINDAVKKGIKFETEIQIIPNHATDYIWMYIVGGPYHGDKPPYTQLSGIAMDITKRKQSEAEISKLQQELLDSARKVGMADVASSILHNVGNVLNSANVSITLMNENIEKSHFKRFVDICKLLKDHGSNIADYFTNDEKGKLIPEYLAKLSASILESYEVEVKELHNITEQIQHIREIVAAQQSLANANKIIEVVKLEEVMDSALRMVGTQLSERGIRVEKKYTEVPTAKVDRNKLVQIIVNFIQNAKDALIYDPDPQKQKLVTLSISKRNDKKQTVDLIVQDNGIGISQDNLDKIFNFGFTTKKTGHGIGMHSCIIAAKEIGASIHAASEGLGKGACFTLSVPTKEIEDGEEYEPSK